MAAGFFDFVDDEGDEGTDRNKCEDNEPNWADDGELFGGGGAAIEGNFLGDAKSTESWEAGDVMKGVTSGLGHDNF